MSKAESAFVNQFFTELLDEQIKILWIEQALIEVEAFIILA